MTFDHSLIDQKFLKRVLNIFINTHTHTYSHSLIDSHVYNAQISTLLYIDKHTITSTYIHTLAYALTHRDMCRHTPIQEQVSTYRNHFVNQLQY